MKRFLKAFLKILLSAAALYYVFTKIEFSDVVAIFRKVDYLLIFIALVFFILSKLLSAWRLNYFFDSAGIKLENKSNIRLYLLGMYYNLFLPGGIGGDGYKIWLLNKKFSIKAKDLFWGVMLDRVNGVFALFLMALLLVPFINLPQEYAIGAIVLIPVTVLVYALINKKFFNKFYKVVTPTTLLSLGVQLLQVLSALFILFANGCYDHLTAYLFLFLISSIVAALPFTIGGIGSREITFLFGAKLLELDINQSIALSLLFYIITLIVSLAGIYYSLNSKALKLNPSQPSNNINLNTSL